MTVPRDGSYIWVTWITGLLAADDQCEWAAWFRAHFTDFEQPPSDFNLAAWKAAHGEMVRTRAEALRVEGWDVYVENQNKFTLKGRAATLGGVPDIVAVRETDGLVIDCKSGKRRDSDAFQVLTYMRVLPITHPACKDVTIAGEVQYRESSLPIEPDQLTDELKGILRGLIERLGSDTPAVKVPSPPECRYCKITAADCPDRIDEECRVAEIDHGIF
jgi:PD-(D/E)XK nuclease superfamily